LGDLVSNRTRNNQLLLSLNLHQSLNTQNEDYRHMSKSITCIHCSIGIIEYFHEGYHGNRGKCPKCGVDFPLE